MNELELWQRATPLAAARSQFASIDLRKRLAEVPKSWGISGSEAVVLFLSSIQEHDPAAKAAAQKRFSESSDAAEVRRGVLEAMEKQVFRRYRLGELLLLGFEHPRRAAAQPLRFGATFLRFMPDWESGTYRHESLHLIELRLIEAPKALPLPSSEAVSVRGRPSIGAAVRAAFEVMASQGLIDARASTASHYPKLRQFMKDAGVDGAESFSNEGIRAHFSPLFNDFKRDRKQ